MGCYAKKDTSDEFLDDEYERLRRNNNFYQLRINCLNKEKAKLEMELSKCTIKVKLYDLLLSAIDSFYAEDKTDAIKYLYDVAHKYDDDKDNISDLDENF